MTHKHSNQMIIEVLLEVFYCCMFGITLGAQMYEFDIVVCSQVVSSIILSIDYLHLHVTLGVLFVCVPVCALYL